MQLLVFRPCITDLFWKQKRGRSQVAANPRWSWWMVRCTFKRLKSLQDMQKAMKSHRKLPPRSQYRFCDMLRPSKCSILRSDRWPLCVE